MFWEGSVSLYCIIYIIWNIMTSPDLTPKMMVDVCLECILNRRIKSHSGTLCTTLLDIIPGHTFSEEI